jgi:hypothetical protein
VSRGGLCSVSYVCEFSLQTQIRHKRFCMVVEVLATNATAMSVRIVSPAEDARVWDIVWKEVAKPVDTICGRPGLVLVSVQPMNDDDTAEGQMVRYSVQDSVYSIRGLSPSATTLRPCGHVSSEGSAAFEEVPTCCHVQPSESKQWRRMATVSLRRPPIGIKRRQRDGAIA